jgi:hypothetical protein
MDEVTLMLARGAAISGRVIDELGEPLVGMPVAVGRITTADGRPRLETGNFTAETDDLGEYRVGGLPAGTFAVAAYGFPAAPSLTTFTTPDGGTITTMLRRPRTVFHPAAPLLIQARPIALKDGEERARSTSRSGATCQRSGSSDASSIRSGRAAIFLSPSHRTAAASATRR